MPPTTNQPLTPVPCCTPLPSHRLRLSRGLVNTGTRARRRRGGGGSNALAEEEEEEEVKIEVKFEVATVASRCGQRNRAGREGVSEWRHAAWPRSAVLRRRCCAIRRQYVNTLREAVREMRERESGCLFNGAYPGDQRVWLAVDVNSNSKRLDNWAYHSEIVSSQKCKMSYCKANVQRGGGKKM